MPNARLKVLERQPDHDPIHDLTEALAELLGQYGSPSERVDLELTSADGRGIAIERVGESLTIRGAVLTLRRAALPDALAGANKNYF